MKPSISELQMVPGLLQMPQGLGEHLPDEALPIGPFIRTVANRLDEEQVAWAVLRNAEGLPEFTRYDVDLLLMPEALPQVIRIVKECAHEAGWRMAGSIRKRHYTCLMLMLGSAESGLFFLPLDLFTGLEYRGLRLLEPERVLKSRIQTPDGIWTIPPGTDAAITLLKEWLPHGVLKENSRESVQSQAAADPEGFQQVLSSAVGDALATVLIQRVKKSEWRISSYESKRLRQELRRRTPGACWAALHAAGSACVHLFRPSVSLMVCLAGADGSGKTTLARELAGQTFKHPFKAVRYSHGNIGVLPRFRDIRAFFRKSEPEQPAEEGTPLKGMMEPIPAWKSVVLATYYAIDLNLARLRIRRWRGQWSLILMDRSFYDYFIQLGHRNCPRGVLRFLSALIPKPDLLLCLTGDAGQIHARKPELTVEEIEREQVLLRELADRVPFGHVLDGSTGIGKTAAAGRDQLLRSLFEKKGVMSSAASAPFRCWTIRNRSVMAYAEGSVEDRLRAIDLFPRTTFKRGLLARAVRLSAFSRCNRKCSSLRDSVDALLPSEELNSVLREMKDALGAGEVDWLVTWPARPERQRIYLIVRARGGGMIGVVKIGAGEFNGRQLRNEAGTLKQLADSTHPFAIPSVLFVKELAGGRTALALSGFPATLRPVSVRHAASAGDEIIGHLRQVPVPTASMRLRDCDWLPAFREHAPGGGAVSRFLAAADETIQVGFAHGDLGPGNMLKDGTGGVLLFDWENASMQAPARTDAVGMWLALRQRKVLRNPEAMRVSFRMEWGSMEESAQIAALAFLCAHGNMAATRILEGWE